MPRRSRSRSRSPRRDRDRTRETRDRRDDRREGRERIDRDRVERGERVERRRDYDREFADRSEREDRGTRDRPDRFSRRSRSPPNFRAAPGSTGPPKPLKEEKKKKFTAEDFAGKTDEEIEMMKLMGFGGFETSKGQKVDGNDVGAVHVKLKRTYRQYMNRRGGFNRPLDAVH